MTNDDMRFIATCKLGMEALVAKELRALGIERIEVNDARVCFFADENLLFSALLYLRCAERVLMEVKRFEAKSFDELFEGVKAIDWRRYLKKDSTIHVNGKSAKSTLFSVSDCQSITKKAIVESLRASYRVNTLPETGSKIIIEIGLLRDEVTLALDACGEGLSRRGYRTYNVSAPLSETLGAGLVLLSRYNGSRSFVDPMCGSGTIPIEAAMIAENRAPGLNRRFAAQDWHFINAAHAYSHAKESALDSITPKKLEILGCDIDERSIALCKMHAKKAGVMLNWAVRPLSGFSDNRPGGILVTNPPYGERMLTRGETTKLYREMSERFSTLDGWGIHIISALSDFERIYGKRAHKKRKLSNGGMQCTLYQYFPKTIIND